MAMMSRTSLLTQAATYTTRTTVAIGVPTYLFLQLKSVPTLRSSPGTFFALSVAVLSTPSTLYCALGALEGFVRSCGHLSQYLTSQDRAIAWNNFTRETTTTHGLVRGALSPLSGYAIMQSEWNKFGEGRDAGSPRVLKEEYYIYAAPRALAHKVVEAGRWVLRQLKLGYDIAIDMGTRALNQLWKGICWITNQAIDWIQWTWNVFQPVRIFLWNVATTAVEWTCNRIVDLWNFTQPVRSFIKWIGWDIFAVKFVWNLLIKKVVWNAIIKTVVWKAIIKTVIWNWILTKFVWNFLVETIFVKVIWPPIRFVLKDILWPIIKWTFTTLGNIISYAFSLIAWATQQAYKLINRRS
jgi:hypothetical protein